MANKDRFWPQEKKTTGFKTRSLSGTSNDWIIEGGVFVCVCVCVVVVGGGEGGRGGGYRLIIHLQFPTPNKFSTWGSWAHRLKDPQEKHIQLKFYNTQPKAEKSPCNSSLAASAQKSVGRMRLPHKRPQSAAVEHQTPTYPRSFPFGTNILSFHSPYFFGKTGDNLAAAKFARTSIPYFFFCLQRGGIRAFKYKRLPGPLLDTLLSLRRARETFISI